MLVGDRGQPGQAHQVFLTGVRIVHPRVASVGGQVLHRLQQCSAVCVGDRLGHHIIGPQRSNQRDALGCAMVRSNPCSPRSPNARPCAPFGAIPSSSQRATTCASASPPTGWISVKPDQGGGYVGVACEQPCWGAGFAFGVVLPQAATCARSVPRGVFGGLGGVNVVVDRPPRELGDRQHRSRHPW